MNEKNAYTWFRMMAGGIALSLLLALAACDKPADPEDVATVNGRPITLQELLSAHDSLTILPPQSMAADTLRQEYGNVLSDLIIAELAEQELEKKRMPVTDAEVDAAEADIRNDFPPGEFENMLLEEAIDYDTWRKALRRRLSMQRLNQQVLMPVLDPKDIERFYLEHKQEFYVSGRVVFIQISALSREQVAEACAVFAQKSDVRQLQQAYPGVTIREIRINKDRLPPELAKAMLALKPLEYTAPQENNLEFSANILLQREAPREYSLAEAYSAIQDRLREETGRQVFDEWLEKRLRKADIRVAWPLFPDSTAKKAP